MFWTLRALEDKSGRLWQERGMLNSESYNSSVVVKSCDISSSERRGFCPLKVPQALWEEVYCPLNNLRRMTSKNAERPQVTCQAKLKMYLPVTHWLLCIHAWSVLHQDAYARKYKIFSSYQVPAELSWPVEERITTEYTKKLGEELMAI